jgi:hypothetical protein
MKQLMRYLILMLMFLPAAQAFAQQSILDFFPVAESLITYPPYKPRLGILGQHKISNWYVSIIGLKETKTIFLAAVTKQPIKNVMKEISLSVKFNGRIPDVGKTSTWGYIFDRNGDGKIDYLALLGGAAPVKDSTFSEDYAYRGLPLRTDDIKYYIKNTKLIFNHWADDNYDGILDGLIHVDMDRDRDMVDRRLVIRSTAFNGQFDDVWALRLVDETVQDSIPHTATSVPFFAVEGKESSITTNAFKEKTEILKILNTAIKKSKLTAKNFFQPGQ